jgi:DNA-3-methyladenine glycosylase
MPCLVEKFYEREVTLVARDLLGMRLVRQVGDMRISGVIVETEAYRGEEDLACHARHGRTKRTEVMYGEAGRAYVYFTYGMHWMFNVVAGPKNFPAAVLIRSLIPLEAFDQIRLNRNDRPQREWCDGPAKLCQALQIDGNLNGTRLDNPQNELWIEEGAPYSDFQVKISPRIGLGTVPEPWLSKPWRYFVSDGKKVS